MSHVLALFLATLSGTAWAATPVSIKSIGHAGSGCPPNAAGTRVETFDTDKDGKDDEFSITFSEYALALPGGGLPRKNCNVTLHAAVSPGHQYTIERLNLEGSADLPKGTRLRLAATYEFPFASEEHSFRTEIPGPHEGSFERTDEVASRDTLWSPCGRDTPLSIRTDLVLQGEGKAQARVARFSGKGKERVKLKWRACP